MMFLVYSCFVCCVLYLLNSPFAAARFFSNHGSPVYDVSCAQAQDVLVEMERALGQEDSDAFPPEIMRMRFLYCMNCLMEYKS